MIPEVESKINMTTINAESKPSKTYRLDLERKQIVGTIDSQEAIKQSVFKLLQTERLGYEIYNEDYGTELNRFIGLSVDFIKSDLERCITDTLKQDERILSIEDFSIYNVTDTSLEVSFVVATVFGEITIDKVVRM